jgi:hypothetical protein
MIVDKTPDSCGVKVRGVMVVILKQVTGTE